jgi:hypothetical protein
MTLPPGLCWVEAYVARINAARAFLAALGMAPERLDREALVPTWRIPMWTGLFSNDELVRFAEKRGFKG